MRAGSGPRDIADQTTRVEELPINGDAQISRIVACSYALRQQRRLAYTPVFAFRDSRYSIVRIIIICDSHNHTVNAIVVNHALRCLASTTPVLDAFLAVRSIIRSNRRDPGP